MKTPYYLVSKDTLDNNIKLLDDALEKNWNNYIVGYSFKTNSMEWLCNYILEKGYSAEVVSDDEYLLAKEIGFENIIYNGIAKSKDTYLEAIRNGNIVNIDSQKEIDWLDELDEKKIYKVGIRINFDLEYYCPGESACGDEGGRFGFCVDNLEFEKALNRIRSKSHIKIAGIHIHCSSKTRSINIYEAIAKVACDVCEKYDIDPEYIDIGGGYFNGLPNKPSFEDYFKVISSILDTRFDKSKTKLIVEPGISLIGSAVEYVTTVVDVKTTTYNTFVITDGSRVAVDPLFRKSSYLYHIDRVSENRITLENQVISGFTCMEDDRLFRLKKSDQLLVGDKIIYENVGAYTASLSPLFIKYYPSVYVKDKDNISEVRKAWTPREYLGKSK